MSPDAEHPGPGDLTDAALLDPAPARGAAARVAVATGVSAADGSGARRAGSHAEHHVLREAGPDRWRWRRKIRQSPHQLAIYRVVVALIGLFFVALGFVSGPIPGPGGIPLVLLGLAIWASEFIWAQRLMVWFKAQLRRFRSWTRPQQTLAWLVFFACCGLFGYCYLLVLGPPGWLPTRVEELLLRLPGL